MGASEYELKFPGAIPMIQKKHQLNHVTPMIKHVVSFLNGDGDDNYNDLLKVLGTKMRLLC
jgi:hypothetical protein